MSSNLGWKLQALLAPPWDPSNPVERRSYALLQQQQQPEVSTARALLHRDSCSWNLAAAFPPAPLWEADARTRHLHRLGQLAP